MRVLGVIPARKGSKSIRNKNIAMLCGKPLIRYTLATAGVWLTRTVVTTDCDEVKRLSRTYPVETIDRPDSLCQDDTPMIPVLQHALSVSSGSFDAVMLLQPTCPMRTSDDIKAAIELMEREKATSVISYLDVGANHPQRMAQIAPNGRPFPWDSSLDVFANKQELPAFYLRSGDIYLTSVECLMQGDLVGEKPRAYIIPKERHCNIDGPLDLAWAEFLMQRETNLAGIG